MKIKETYNFGNEHKIITHDTGDLAKVIGTNNDVKCDVIAHFDTYGYVQFGWSDYSLIEA